MTVEKNKISGMSSGKVTTPCASATEKREPDFELAATFMGNSVSEVQCYCISRLIKMSPGRVTFRLAAALLLSAVVSAKNIKFTSCGGNMKSVDVSPCDTEPCEIPRGSSVNITGVCVSDYDSAKLKMSIFGTIEDIEVPFPGMRRDGCKGKNITCPIKKGQEISYIQSLPIKKFFPKIETIAKIVLLTNDGLEEEVICCFQAPVKVV